MEPLRGMERLMRPPPTASSSLLDSPLSPPSRSSALSHAPARIASSTPAAGASRLDPLSYLLACPAALAGIDFPAVAAELDSAFRTRGARTQAAAPELLFHSSRG